MRWTTLLTASCLLLVLNVYGQAQQKFVINPGQRVVDVLTARDLYEFPEFRNGSVLFADSARVEALLNYNLLAQTVQFVSPGGDTLSLADENKIKSISIDGHAYLFNKEYYEVLRSFGQNKFLLRQRIRVLSAKKIGAYGQTVEGGANSYSNFSSGATDMRLATNEKITLTKEEACFFCDRNGQIYSASKRNFLSLLPKNQQAAEEFCQKNAIDFKNKEDIQKLVDFVNSL